MRNTTLLWTVILPCLCQSGFALEHGQAQPQIQQRGLVGKLFAPFLDIYEEFDRKLTELRKLDENYQHMQTKVTELEVEIQMLRSEKSDWVEGSRANDIKSKALSEGGVEYARTIASLEHENQGILTKKPGEIYDFAIKAFGREDYGSAAFAFVLLINKAGTDEPEGSAEIHYMAGVSLYHLDNFKSAEKYFRKTVALARDKKRVPASQSGSTGKIEKFAPSAMAWWSLCRSRVGDIAGAKHIIRELIEWYPKSREARRLNRNESFN